MDKETDALDLWYNAFGDFVASHQLYLSELDYYISQKLNLYAVYEQLDFTEIRVATDKMKACMPAIGRIFGKPIIHLIEEEDVLPVESIRYINSKAITHIASHSELWADVTEDGIQPRKLLSRSYIDNYSIYENVVFANTIDLLLAYVRNKFKVLDDLMFSMKTHNVNVLDRSNHFNYYLALGKLHKGYIRNYNVYLEEANSLKSQLLRFYHKVSSRLYKKVYRLNSDKRITSLHKTNILAMDKDYRKIYQLYKFLDGYKSADFKKWLSFDNPNYFLYCEILSVFAIQHFGFDGEPRAKLDFYALNLDFTNKVYRLNVKTLTDGENRALLLTFENDRLYRILLYPLCKYVKKPVAGGETDVDEVIFLSPLPANNARLVSITELDSFRRLQQILLKGMIMSTERFEICPFCQQTLKKDEDKERYVCPSCHQIVERAICPEKGLPYYNTDVDNINKYKTKADLIDTESRLNYRNINKLTPHAFVCPICKKPH